MRSTKAQRAELQELISTGTSFEKHLNAGMSMRAAKSWSRRTINHNQVTAGGNRDLTMRVRFEGQAIHRLRLRQE